MRVSDTGTHLRIRFVNFQNLEYGDTDDKYPKFGYGCRVCLTKIKKFNTFSYESYLWKNFNYIIIKGFII